MMNAVPNEKSKKKGKPVSSIWIKRLLLAIWILLTALVLLVMLLAPTVTYPYIDAQQIAETCEILALAPDNDFCAEPGKQTSQTLREVMHQTYPTDVTTIWELRKRVRNVECDAQTYGFCAIILPITGLYLYVQSNEEGQVTAYATVNQQGPTRD